MLKQHRKPLLRKGFPVLFLTYIDLYRPVGVQEKGLELSGGKCKCVLTYAYAKRQRFNVLGTFWAFLKM